jgi:Holliday junction resolvase RusA-like endonuclease
VVGRHRGRLDLDNCRKVVTDALKEVAIVDDFWIWKDTGEVMEPRRAWMPVSWCASAAA